MCTSQNHCLCCRMSHEEPCLHQRHSYAKGSDKSIRLSRNSNNSHHCSSMHVSQNHCVCRWFYIKVFQYIKDTQQAAQIAGKAGHQAIIVVALLPSSTITHQGLRQLYQMCTGTHTNIQSCLSVLLNHCLCRWMFHEKPCSQHQASSSPLYNRVACTNDYHTQGLLQVYRACLGTLRKSQRFLSAVHMSQGTLRESQRFLSAMHMSQKHCFSRWMSHEETFS